jgi:hypothetical protein
MNQREKKGLGKRYGQLILLQDGSDGYKSHQRLYCKLGEGFFFRVSIVFQFTA